LALYPFNLRCDNQQLLLIETISTCVSIC